MKQLSDEEIVGRYVPRGLSPAHADATQVQCGRLRCAHIPVPAGARAHRWAPRQAPGPAIELCPRCHLELVTILSGG